MQSSRRFEILFVRFPFSEFRAFSWCQTREREIYTPKKTEEEEEKTDCYPKHLFLFVCFSRHKAFTLTVGPFLRVTKHPHKTERDHIRFEKKKKKKKRREEVVILNA
jgi:hypothetical protein